MAFKVLVLSDVPTTRQLDFFFSMALDGTAFIIKKPREGSVFVNV